MKKATMILAVLLTAMMNVTISKAQASFGEATLFDDGWLFQLKDSAVMNQNSYDDSHWRKLTLPHDWSVEGTLSPSLASCTGYLPAGIAWYRKHFEIKDKADRHYIYFEGVYNRSEVYLNGQLLGKRPNGYVSFMYDMTPYLKEGENVLAVRVDHSRYADSRWYTGSGIYRDVYLISAPDTHLSLWGTAWRATKINQSAATVEVDMEVEKHAVVKENVTFKAMLFDANGRQVASKQQNVTVSNDSHAKKTLTLNVAQPKMWDLNSPYLYTLKTELISKGKRIDGGETRVGLRTLQFDANKGFALNGQWMKVKGVCIHHDGGVLGSAVPREVWQRRLQNLKDIGTNAIRMSHNPQSPDVYDICDEIGLLVMDEGSDEWEFPKRKWIEGWNVGTPGFDGTADFFNEWIETDVADIVRRDRNHPCIFLWSVGNEVDYPNDPYSHPILNGTTINQPMFGGYKPDAPDAMRIGEIAKRLANVIRSIDTSRPTTGALAGVVMSNQTAYPDAIDVVGYNYTENRYDEDHQTYPNRIIYGSENSSGIQAWRAVEERDFIFGQFIWTGLDYLGESGRWPSRGMGTGLLDFCGFPKPNGYLRASLWLDKPMTYLTTYSMSMFNQGGRQRRGGARNIVFPGGLNIWNYENGESIRVVCYTNTPQARLTLNGKVVGEMKPYDRESGLIYWDVPFEAGTLRAESCDAQGNVVSSYEVKTSGLPYQIKATVDKPELKKERGTAHVLIEIMDEKGNPVRLADNNVVCMTEGPVRLLGLEAADNTDMGNYRDNMQRVYHGRMIAYVQATGEAGTAKVKLTSPMLKGTEVTIDVK